MYTNFSRAKILSTGILALIVPHIAQSAVLDRFTFGTTPPSVLTPTEVAPFTLGTSIVGNTGIALDLKSDQGNPPPSSPWLRVVPNAPRATAQAAIDGNADFSFTLSAVQNGVLNLSSLDFGALKGGSGIRGFAVRSSVDGFTSTIASSDITNTRGAGVDFQPFSISLIDAAYQGLSSITFRIYSYSPGSGSSVEYDNIVINGTTAFSIPTYTWTGAASDNWDTTSANWTGVGAVYQDATTDSNVVFDDSAAGTGVIAVTPNALSPNSIAFGNSTKNYSLTGSALNVAENVSKTGTGTLTIANSVSALNVDIGSGSVVVSSTGTLSAGAIGVISQGSLTVDVGGSLGADSVLSVNSTATLNNAAQSLLGLSGNGTVNLNGTVLTVTGGSTFGGSLTGSGSLVKSDFGSLVLSGNTSSFFGGTTINGGAIEVNANSANALGSGLVTVNTGGTLVLASAIPNQLILDGGTLGNKAAVTLPNGIEVASDSIIASFNPLTFGSSADIIFNGMLTGSGDIEIQTLNGNNPDSTAIRFRGLSSDYSGTIRMPQSSKVEIQNNFENGSPIGTGVLVMEGGSFGTNANGTFSILNVRNNNLGNTSFGNDLTVQGFGAVFLNLLGGAPAGSVTEFGKLTIGSGQSLVIGATGSLEFTAGFTSVDLTGGDATLVPTPVGNTSFLSRENLALANITESVSGSGISLNGLGSLTLTGASSYTGATSVANGTLIVNGTLNGTLGVAVSNGALQGTGTINAPVTLGDGVGLEGTALIGPASSTSIGTLTTGAIVAGFSDVRFELQLDSSTLAKDLLAVNGGLDLGLGVATLALADLGGAPLGAGQVFTLATATGGVTGFFLGFGEGAMFDVGINTYTISYLDNAITLTSVPEPGSALLLLAAASGAAGLGRFRRQRQ